MERWKQRTIALASIACSIVQGLGLVMKTIVVIVMIAMIVMMTVITRLPESEFSPGTVSRLDH